MTLAMLICKSDQNVEDEARAPNLCLRLSLHERKWDYLVVISHRLAQAGVRARCGNAINLEARDRPGRLARISCLFTSCSDY
jgi:hypothetical protein